MPPDDKKPTTPAADEVQVDHEPPVSIDSLLHDRDELRSIRAREADAVARRLEKIPPAIRARVPRGASVAEQAAFLDGLDVALGATTPRSPGTPGLGPPPGLVGHETYVFESDVVAMDQKAREKFFASAEYKRALAEGRFVRSSQEPMYRHR